MAEEQINTKIAVVCHNQLNYNAFVARQRKKDDDGYNQITMYYFVSHPADCYSRHFDFAYLIVESFNNIREKECVLDVVQRHIIDYTAEKIIRV